MDSELRKEIDRYNDTGMYYIIKDVDNLDDLEREWNSYSSLHKDLRKRSDERSIEFFGQSNIDRYNQMKSKLLAKDNFDIEDIPLESARIVKQLRFKDNIEIKYTDEDIENAIEYNKTSLRNIVYPVDTLEELENLWDAYNNQHKQLRREADWKSLELFGMNNQDHFEYLRSKFLYLDIDDEPEEEISSSELYPNTNLFESTNIKLNFSPFEFKCLMVERSEGILEDLNKLELSLYKTKSISESIKKEKVITLDRDTDGFMDNKLIYDIPSLSPEEMIDKGVFGNDNYYAEYIALKIDENYTSKDWFEEYKNACCGIVSEDTHKIFLARNNKLKELYYELKSNPNDNRLKQWILELGWEPELEYTPHNQQMMINRAKSKLKELYSRYEHVDVRGIENIDYIEEAEIDEDNILYPLYIVILSSKSTFGKIIKKATNSIYTHGAISFDSVMNRIYSYDREGFTYDNLEKYKEDSDLYVSVLFLKRKDIIKLKTRLDYFIANKKNTRYGYANLIRVLTNKPKESEMNLICSEFVDKMLKYIDIDITHKSSNLVTPKDLASNAKNNKKIYKVYFGKTGKYNKDTVDKRVNKLMSTAKVFKEYFINKYSDDIISKYEIEAIGESKEFPVQFDKEGNLLIKNLKKINYNEEFNKSHKLLLSYEKTGNIEGMKYELSKLWFMYNVLEKIRHEKKMSREELKALDDSRARIYNDFQKYLKIVQEKEKDFNFSNYYDNSPFSDASYKVNASTIKYTKGFIKSLLF